jgi:hypothetical protein
MHVERNLLVAAATRPNVTAAGGVASRGSLQPPSCHVTIVASFQAERHERNSENDNERGDHEQHLSTQVLHIRSSLVE